jgi:hypothetical protein
MGKVFSPLQLNIIILKIKQFKVGPFSSHEKHDALWTNAIVGKLKLCNLIWRLDEVSYEIFHAIVANVAITDIKYSFHLLNPSIDSLSSLRGN